MPRFTPACSVLISVLLLVFLIGPPTLCSASSGPHISDVNILLPPKMTNPVEYRLQGSHGCFTWSWDHHDILSVHPEYSSSSHCSTSARLRSIAPYNGRKETAVYATDVLTGTVVRCKVFIDNIYRIQIFHNSITLDIDGLSALRVRAFDNEENEFSSLVGLQFMWQLMLEANDVAHNVIHVPLKDSPLSDCGGSCGDLDIQIKLEDSGMFSDLYVVKGTGIGPAIVSVHLLEPGFDFIKYKIVLTVVEAMSLAPPRANIPRVVTLPSPFHRWSIVNSAVARVDKLTGSSHVVLPEVLSLYMLPLSPLGDYIDGIDPTLSLPRWYVVTGRTYLVEMKIVSQGPWAQEIHITENPMQLNLTGIKRSIITIIGNTGIFATLCLNRYEKLVTGPSQKSSCISNHFEF